MGKGAGNCLSASPSAAAPQNPAAAATAPAAVAAAPVAQTGSKMPVKIAIIYYSTYNHVATLAEVRDRHGHDLVAREGGYARVPQSHSAWQFGGDQPARGGVGRTSQWAHPLALHVPAAHRAPRPPPPPLSPVSQKVKAGVDSVEGCEATIFQVGGLGGLAGCTGLSVWKRGAGGSGACDRAVG